MKFRIAALLLLLSFLPFTGCQINTPAPVTVSGAGQPPVIMLTLNESLEEYANAWKDEIARRFPNSVAVFVHGGENINGVWTIETYPVLTAKEMMQRAMNKYPGRTPILLSCNPGYLKLGLPGVYHATANVWCIPDRAVLSLDDIKAKATLAVIPGFYPTTIPATIPATLPTTAPATKPTSYPSFGLDDFFDFSPGSVPFVFSRPEKNVVFKTRWQDVPECVGNIFEFVTD